MKIEGTDIKMIRGDSETITVSSTDTLDQPIAFVDGDIIYFTIKENMNNTEKVLQKSVSAFVDGKATIVINHNDTKDLLSMIYVYDIQWTRLSGEVTTLVEPSNFQLEGM